MDVQLFQACGVWQTLSCYTVTLLVSVLHKHQHLPKQRKMLSSQALFKTPRGGRVAEEYICLLNRATGLPSEKVNNCYASLEWKRVYKKRQI